MFYQLIEQSSKHYKHLQSFTMITTKKSTTYLFAGHSRLSFILMMFGMIFDVGNINWQKLTKNWYTVNSQYLLRPDPPINIPTSADVDVMTIEEACQYNDESAIAEMLALISDG